MRTFLFVVGVLLLIVSTMDTFVIGALATSLTALTFSKKRRDDNDERDERNALIFFLVILLCISCVSSVLAYACGINPSAILRLQAVTLALGILICALIRICDRQEKAYVDLD